MRTNYEELDLFADLLDPVSEIITDKAILEVFQRGGKPIVAVKNAVKYHKDAVIEILARVDGVPVEEYHVSAVTIPIKLLALVNSPAVQEFFGSQGQNLAAAPSGSATENIEGGEN